MPLSRWVADKGVRGPNKFHLHDAPEIGNQRQPGCHQAHAATPSSHRVIGLTAVGLAEDKAKASIGRRQVGLISFCEPLVYDVTLRCSWVLWR